MPRFPFPRFVRQICLLAGIGCGVVCFATRAFPEEIKSIHATGYVTDLVGVIQAETKAQLEALGLELEQKTGAQMAVVTVHSLEGQSVQVYANDLFKQLGVGHKDNRGVMLLVAPDDHKYWTEVGYGLEPVINDARAGDAGRLMVPYFKQGDYSSGISAAASQLANYIADDRGVTLSLRPQYRELRPAARSSGGPSWIFILVVIAFIIFFGRGGGLLWFLLGMLGSGSGGRSSGGWGGGGWGGGGDGGGFGGFGGGSSGGGGAGGSW
jgi:uncharacterized protein